jgi:hypothetical protein
MLNGGGSVRARSACFPVITAIRHDIEHLNAHRSSRLVEGHEIRALPRRLISGAKAEGRFGKQDFVYVAADDVYICPAGERLTYRFSGEEARSCGATGRRRAGRVH